MAAVFFTLCGTRHYHGQDFIEPGMKVKLVKEPDNQVDKEAILVELEGMGKVGYVANSPYTVLGESMSAGRLYDRIGDTATAVVVYKTEKAVLCRVKKKSILYTPGIPKQAEAV